ncbi:hypothetical protein GHC57_19040 [Roseospira navarrensis]|uniref:Uncharacterized protein n=2 Tax=Roseospira navarrensis TaxID=140058 RepID=A0A7X1ZHF7_9PROT|nr:hypothetical protein [Roseospira navarrensis]
MTEAPQTEFPSLRLLNRLARYRFMTVAQLIATGAGKDRKHLGQVLRRLEGHKHAGMLAWGVRPGLGRLPRMYYLKPAGAAALAAYFREEPARYGPIARTPKFTVDHLHRRHCVDCHIALDAAMEAEGGSVARYVAYYGGPGPWPGANGQAKADPIKLRLASGRALIPDAICDLQRGDGRRQLHALEMCMDRGGTDRARIVRQIESHCEAMSDGALSDALGLDRGYRLLCVFENRPSLDAVRRRLADEGVGENFARLILMNTHKRSRDDFASGWVDAAGDPAPF